MTKDEAMKLAKDACPYFDEISKGAFYDGFLMALDQLPYATKMIEPIVAGAVYDFAGFITTRDKVIRVGATADAAPVADLVKEWANRRSLSLEDAAVGSWGKELAEPPNSTTDVVESTDSLSTLLWRDLKTDRQRADWLRLGRGYQTGVVAAAIQQELAMAYERLVGFQKIHAALEQPEQEPVAWMVSPAITIMPNFAFCVTKTKMHTIPLYTAPPKREWQRLTDEEKWSIFTSKDWTGKPLSLIDAVLTAYEEKNRD